MAELKSGYEKYSRKIRKLEDIIKKVRKLERKLSP